MPSKKGSKVAASQARAKAAAKKKARQTGPVLPAAAYVPPPVEEEEASAGTETEPVAAVTPVASAARRPQATLTRPQAVRAIGMRRERHVTPAVGRASLKRELSMIGTLTALCGIALAVLKMATDLGA